MAYSPSYLSRLDNRKKLLYYKEFFIWNENEKNITTKMTYTISKGLLREGSLSAKIYFLFLKPKTQSEISKIIYGGKTQLSNIRKNMDDLEKVGYIKKIGRKIGYGKNFNQIYYQSTLIPILEMIKERVGTRNSTSKSKNKKALIEEDLKFIEDFLSSKWFSQFYEQNYLKDDLECENVGNFRICSCPIRFFAFLLEEIFVIRQVMQKVKFLFEKEEVGYLNFDDFVSKRKRLLTKMDKKLIHNIFEGAKTGYLGNYPSTNRTIDKYLKNYGVLFLPYGLSKKLSALGRVPLTISIAFNQAIEKEYNRLD